MATKYCNPDLGSGDNDGTSEANAYQDFETAVDALSAGDILYVKKTSSRHSPGATVTLTVSGDETDNIIIEGYGTTPGDGTQFQLGNDVDITGDYIALRNFDIELSGTIAINVGSGKCVVKVNNGKNLYFDNCIFKNSNTTYGSPAVHILNGAPYFLRCSFDSVSNHNTTGALHISTYDTAYCFGCVFRGDNGIGAQPYGNDLIIMNSIFYDNDSKDMDHGIRMEASSASYSGEMRGLTLIGNTFYKPDDAALFLKYQGDASGKCYHLIMNNIVWGGDSSVTEAFENIDTSHKAGFYIVNNAVGNCANVTTNMPSGASMVFGTITLEGDPFVDGDGRDFRINGTTSGAACKGVDYITSFNGVTGSNQADLGAIRTSGLTERISVS